MIEVPNGKSILNLSGNIFFFVMFEILLDVLCLHEILTMDLLLPHTRLNLGLVKLF